MIPEGVKNAVTLINWAWRPPLHLQLSPNTYYSPNVSCRVSCWVSLHTQIPLLLVISYPSLKIHLEQSFSRKFSLTHMISFALHVSQQILYGIISGRFICLSPALQDPKQGSKVSAIREAFGSGRCSHIAPIPSHTSDKRLWVRRSHHLPSWIDLNFIISFSIHLKLKKPG